MTPPGESRSPERAAAASTVPAKPADMARNAAQLRQSPSVPKAARHSPREESSFQPGAARALSPGSTQAAA